MTNAPTSRATAASCRDLIAEIEALGARVVDATFTPETRGALYNITIRWGQGNLLLPRSPNQIRAFIEKHTIRCQRCHETRMGAANHAIYCTACYDAIEAEIEARIEVQPADYGDQLFKAIARTNLRGA